MRGRIRVRVGEQHLIILSLHQYVLLFILHLIYLFLLGAVYSLPLHVLLLLLLLQLLLLLLLLIACNVLAAGKCCHAVSICRLLGGLLMWCRLLLLNGVRLLGLKPLRPIFHLLLIRVPAVLPGVLKVLILTAGVRLLIHGSDVLVRVLSREESRLRLPFPYVIDHATELRRGAFTLRKMRQVLKHRLLALIAKLALPIVLEIVNLLLVSQRLFELQLLLHFLLLVCQNGMLARGLLLIVDGTVGH